MPYELLTPAAQQASLPGAPGYVMNPAFPEGSLHYLKVNKMPLCITIANAFIYLRPHVALDCRPTFFNQTRDLVFTKLAVPSIVGSFPVVYSIVSFVANKQEETNNNSSIT